MSVRSKNVGRQIWGAHAARVLVSASRRNNLSTGRGFSCVNGAYSKVRDRGDTLANTRDACAPQITNRRSRLQIRRPWASADRAYP